MRLPFCLLLAAAPALAQTTVNVQCAADNTLYEDALGSTSNGSGPSFYCGRTATGLIRRAVLRFDVAAIVPAGARILSAQLNLNVAQSTAFLPITTEAHRLLQAWGEGASVAPGGGGGGTLAATGDATWLHTFYSTTFWSTAGGSFGPTTFTFDLPGFGPASATTSPALVADVQSFLDSPSANFGWLLKTDELAPSTARRIDSREGATKPMLSVTYLPSGQGGTWGTGCPVGAGNFGASFVGAPIGGTTVQIAQTGAPAVGIGTTFYSLDLDTVGVGILPGCTVYLPLAGELLPGSIFVTDAAGAASQPFPVPAGFAGYLVVGQSIVLTNNTLGFVISNAALACLQ